MSWLRVLVVVFVVLVVLVIGAALALPRLIDGEQVRARVTEAVYAATGRELQYEALEFGVMPPSLRVMGPALSGESAGAPALLEAREVALRVSLLPLFWGTVLVDTLVVDGATVRLTRGLDGLELPTPPAAPEAAESLPADGEDQGGVSLAVRNVRLADSTLFLDDRAVTPPVAWEFRELNLTTKGALLSGALALEGQARLASGGRIGVSGHVGADGALDLEVNPDEFELAPLDSYIEGVRLAGPASGRIELVGPASELERVAVDLRGKSLSVAQGDIGVDGDLSIVSTLAAPMTRLAGPFDVDVSDARLRVGTVLDKPAGTRGRVSGTLVSGAGGRSAIDGLVLQLHELDASGRVSSLSPLAIELDAPAIDLVGWERVLPALADSVLTGELKLEGLSYDAEARAIGGAIALGDVSRAASGDAPVVLNGRLLGEGDVLRGDGLTLAAGGETVPFEFSLSELFDAVRYRVAVETDDAEANRTLTAFLGKPDTLYGPLALDGVLAGPLGGDVVSQARGKMAFDVTDGRLAGVSILKSVFDRFGAAGGAAVDLGRVVGGSDLQRFYGDKFERLSADFDVIDGVAQTENLTFRYEGYEVLLRGRLGIEDLSLEMTGQLTLRESIDQAIAKSLGVTKHTPRARNVPLASVTGSLDAPVVRLGGGAATNFVSAYAVDAYAGEITERVKEELGEDAGVLVDQGLEVLQGIFGAGQRETSPPPEEPAPEPSAPPAPTPSP